MKLCQVLAVKKQVKAKSHSEKAKLLHLNWLIDA
jgi:hypothetical protein